MLLTLQSYTSVTVQRFTLLGIHIDQSVELPQTTTGKQDEGKGAAKTSESRISTKKISSMAAVYRSLLSVDEVGVSCASVGGTVRFLVWADHTKERFPWC